MSYARTALLVAATIAGCSVAQAQSSLSQPPRFDSPGCGGIMCRQRDPGAPDPSDPAQAAAAAAYYGPPCGGILCEMDPRGMRPPVTAGDAQEAERRRQEAAGIRPAVVASGDGAGAGAPRQRSQEGKTYGEGRGVRELFGEVRRLVMAACHAGCRA